MKAVIFGAGNIGRGFIGKVLHDSGFSICFLDTNNTIIDQINQDKGYIVNYIDEQDSHFFIDNVSALNTMNNYERGIEELLTADIICTAVGIGNLKRIAPLLSTGLLERAKLKKRVNVLANENAINASDSLKKEVYSLLTDEEKELIDNYVFFVNTAIDRQSLTVKQNDKFISLVEPYFEWVISKARLDPETEYKLNGVTIVDNMQLYIERKLYIVNAAHAAFAYLGYVFEYKTIQQAMRDENLYKLVKNFLIENNEYFVKHYRQGAKKGIEFIEKTLKRHGNPKISDNISRVGKSPIRKLRNNDRLAAPVLKLEDLKLPNESGLKIIAAAYHYYDNEDDESKELYRLINKVGINEAIRRVSSIFSPTTEKIEDYYYVLRENKNEIFLNKFEEE